MNKVAVWDGWRGMAIILLLCGHFVDTPWIWEDRLGVDAFFVLSGMLMSTILFEKRMRLRDFYIRRFSRIVPVFTLFILVSFSFAKLKGLDFEIIEIFTNLTFLRTYIPLDPHIWSTEVPVQHLWSLNIEEHAYIIMSIFTLFIFRNSYVALVLILLGLSSIGICFYYYLNEASAPVYYEIRTESSISFIFLSAGYNLIKNKLNITVHHLAPVCSLLAAFSCYLEMTPDWLVFSFAPILLAFTLNHIREANVVLRGILEVKMVRLMGVLSFSIYLWQQPVYKYKWWFSTLDYGLSYLSVLLAIAIGMVSFYVIERPVRAWINNRWTKNV